MISLWVVNVASELAQFVRARFPPAMYLKQLKIVSTELPLMHREEMKYCRAFESSIHALTEVDPRSEYVRDIHTDYTSGMILYT